jgi:hypothetical protein
MITEADTCRKYVLPKLREAGWSDDQISEQKTFTDGRIIVIGDKVQRKKPKRADYVLRIARNFPIAVIEAKAAYKKSGDGLQQAKEYAEILGLKFAYSTNGRGMGLIPPKLDGAIVTNDFLTYDINENKLMPKYFDYLTSTECFVQECIKASEGTTNRVRLKPDKFLNVEILLPSLAEQKHIVAKIAGLMAKVEDAKIQHRQADEELELLSTCAFGQIFSFPKDVSLNNLPVEQCCEAIIDYRGRPPPLPAMESLT